MAIAYNTTAANCSNIYTTTGGGTVFSANLAASTAFNYFSNTAVVNDAIYFCFSGISFSNLILNVGTPLSGTGVTVVWEYFTILGSVWRPCHNLTDGSNGFTTTGAVTVKFPLQAGMGLTTVNGVSNITAVRCRITALTSISNGGAQSTTTVKKSDGKIAITGYTDGAPCTWLDVYNWVIANAPEIGATKVSFDTFKFDNCAISISNGSTLRSTSEKIYMGNGCRCPGLLIAGLWSGTKVSPNGWTASSSYFFCYFSSTNILTSGTTTRIFGGVWEWFTNIVDGLTCTPGGSYLGITSGEWRGVYARQSGYFVDGTVDRCTVDGGLITAAAVTLYPTNMNIANPGALIWTMYGVGNTITGVTYGLPTTTIMTIVAAYNGSPAQQYNFINPNPSFGNQTDAVKIATRGLGSLASITNCFYYNSGTTLFTDYTAQAQSSTVDDVPLGGSVGDIYYFKTSFVNTNYQPALTFTITPQTNNYTYAYEYWNGSSWIALVSNVSLYDTTNNFQQSGIVYFGTYTNFASTTINGSTGFFVRIRITYAGTGSPTVSKIEQRQQAGIGNWKINEQYYYNLKVTDSSSTAVQSAICYLKDALGNVIGSYTTDSNGNITQQTLLKQYFYFDPSVSETYFNIAQQSVNPYLVRIRRYGYVFQDLSKTVTGISNDVGVLATNTIVQASEATALAYTGISINTSTQKITLTTNHTINELYDYCQAWLAQSSNIATTEFLTTSDGSNYSCIYDLEINNCNLTGSGIINMPTKTLSFVGTGKTTLIVKDLTGTKVNITLTGLTANTRVQLYNLATSTEVYNAIVTGTSLVVPVTWTTDQSIRIRAMYVNGTSAKKWIEVVGTLTNAGLNYTVNQEDDLIYNGIGIDGSTVTECSISGSTLVINIDDADNLTTAQRILAFEIYWLYTASGIRDQNLYIEYSDATHLIFLGGLKIKNSDLVNPLSVTGASIVPESGNPSDVIDSTGGSININTNRVVGFNDTTKYLTTSKFLGLK